MYIGITEQGDAGVDFSWEDKIRNGHVNGAVLITKKLSDEFNKKVLNLHKDGFQTIVHSTITGWGGTEIEPHVPDYNYSVQMLWKLIESGYPRERCVLRIDPIFPSRNGIARFKQLIDCINQTGLLPIRIRISILDEYKHVKDRFIKSGYHPMYGMDNLYPGNDQIKMVSEALIRTSVAYNIKFECCTEKRLVEVTNTEVEKYGMDKICIEQGCISKADLSVMSLKGMNFAENMQNQNECHCISCKKELLDQKKRCPNGCIYCYWKD